MVGMSEAVGVMQLLSRPADDDEGLESEAVGVLSVTVAGQVGMAFMNLRLRDRCGRCRSGTR
jgi:hypothetical protein